MTSFPVAGVPGLYLLHFERPFHHAQHYLGWARHREERIQAHLEGDSDASRLMRAVHEAGIKVTWVQFLDGGKSTERKIKNRGTLKKTCLMCRPEYNVRAARHMRMSRRQLRLFVEAFGPGGKILVREGDA